MVEILDRFGNIVTNPRSQVNVLRKKYGSMEKAYWEVHNILAAPVCSVCDAPVKFINFVNGYAKLCKACLKQNSVLALRNRTRTLCVEDFLGFYYDNTELFLAGENCAELNVVEPFSGRKTGSFTLRGYVRKYYGSKHFPDSVATCIVCREEMRVDFFSSTFCCTSHKCRPNPYRDAQITKTKNLNDIRWESRDKTLDYVCAITGKRLYLVPSSGVFTKHLKTLNVSFLEYMQQYEPAALRYCSTCEILIPPDNSYPIRPYASTGKNGKYFCCHEHYVAYRVNNPNILQCCSPEQAAKHSETMKRLIREGKLTPKRNHYTNWKTKLDGKSYRSRWEAAFHCIFPYMKYEFFGFRI